MLLVRRLGCVGRTVRCHVVLVIWDFRVVVVVGQARRADWVAAVKRCRIMRCKLLYVSDKTYPRLLDSGCRYERLFKVVARTRNNFDRPLSALRSPHPMPAIGFTSTEQICPRSNMPVVSGTDCYVFFDSVFLCSYCLFS